MKSIRDYSEQIDKIKEAIRQADAILIGAGAGLSSSAGFTYSGERFHENFRDFEEKYGFQDMYSGGFYPFSAPEEFWAYWSRYVMINRYANPPKPVYENLLSIVKDKEYFVLTTNVDHCFQKAGFDRKRLFYTQGDYGLFQCSVPCHDQTYDNEEEIRKMYRAQKDRKIPTELIPHCPICGKPMKMNLRADDTFIQDQGWYEALERYERFVRNYRDKSYCFSNWAWEATRRSSSNILLEFHPAKCRCALRLRESRRSGLPSGDKGAIDFDRRGYRRGASQSAVGFKELTARKQRAIPLRKNESDRFFRFSLHARFSRI